ncbi:MAG: DUF2127 domain-containing protein [Arenimonas sp.]
MSEHHRIREASDKVEHALHLNARRKLRIVALIDVVKGAVVLAIAFGLLSAHSHVLERGGVSLLQLLDIDSGLVWPRKFLALLHAADTEKGLLVLAASAYGGLRFVESWGLWRMRNWARWLGIVSAGIYVPFELYYLFRTPNLTSVSVLSINLAVLWLLWPGKPFPKAPPEPGIE